MGKNIIAAAFDFCDDFCQISTFDGISQEPQSVSTIYNDKRYLIPAVIWVDDANGQMIFGDEAVRRSEKGIGTKVTSLISAVKNEDKFLISDKEYSGEELFGKYVGYLFKVLMENVKSNRPEYVAITLEEPADRKFMDILLRIMKDNNVEEDKLCVQTHTESFMYYVLSQSKDIWANDVALFDFSENYFKYRRMYIDKTKTPAIVRCEEEDLTESVPYEFLDNEAGKAMADETLQKFVEEHFREHIISAAFLTGSGFYKEWAEKSMALICSRRRVFKGYNLFVKGACYAAMEKAGRVRYDRIRIMCGQRTEITVSLVAGTEEDEKKIVMSEEGTNWYEAGAYTEVIVDGADMLKFQVDSVSKSIRKMYGISLEEFPKRPPRTTRLGIAVRYDEPHKCVITVEDKGFGELFKSSGKIIEEFREI